MKYINYLLLTLVAAVGCVFTSCEDDNDTNLSRAVLASVSLLEFEKESADVAVIKVTSDADWYVEAPEWVIVSPSSGHAGRTEVTIQVMDNYRDGALDNPRKANVLFKGRDLNSIATVRITQDGDRYRDPIQYLTTDLENLEDEVYVQVADLVVTTVTGTGFIATDGNYNLYVTNPENMDGSDAVVAAGQKLTAHGEKMTDTMGFIYIADAIIKNVTTGSFTLPTPIDITDNLDNVKYKTREYVTVTGDYDGSAIAVEGAKNNKAYFEDPADDLKVSSYIGHKVKVTGYYAGTAAPMVKIIPVEIEDLGSNEIIYFFDDFEWLAPWAEAGGCGDTIGTDNPNATSPQLVTPKVDGVSSLDALLAKGYEFLRVTTKTAGECIYLNSNYLKFGKTSYQAGVILPQIDGIPENEKLELSFDWCPQRQGDGKIDPVNLIVIISQNGVEEEPIAIPTHGWETNHNLEWIHAVVDLSDYEFDETTRITIRQTEWPAATANRWFFDNVKLRKK